MRIRQLFIAGDPPIALDLHPGLTVVTGLGPVGRARVLDAVASVLAGQCEDVSGVIEAEGAEFDIEPDLCEMLGLSGHGTDVVLRAGEPATDVERWEVRLREVSDRRTALLGARRAEVADELAALAREAEEALAADPRYANLTERLAAIDEERAAVRAAPERVSELEAELEALGRRLDVVVAERDAIETRLTDDSWIDDDSDLDREAEDLAARRAALLEDGEMGTDLLESLGLEQASPVEAALEAFRFLRSWTPEELPEAIAIADRLASLAERRASAPKAGVPEWLRTQTIQQLEEARAAVAAAEQLQTVPTVDPNRAAALEEAHAAVDEAEDQASRRFGGMLAKRRLANAREAEAAILKELGFSSYAEFLMGQAGGAGADPDADRRLAEAKAALADADAVWDEIQGHTDFAWPGTDAEEDGLRTQAATLLGPVVAETAGDTGRRFVAQGPGRCRGRRLRLARPRGVQRSGRRSTRR